MNTKYIILTIATLSLAASLIASAQEKQANARAQDQTPFAKMVKKQEQNLKVTIQAKNQYRYGEAAEVDVSLTNNSTEALGTYLWNQYLQESPQLLADGKPVPYRKDKDVSFEGKSGKVDINPRPTGYGSQETRKLRTINLLDWYGVLKPGTYQLTVGHRFWLKGLPVKSDTVTFEIVP